MDTLISIKVFRQVVESGSFVAAAERLNLSTEMTTKHLMHIEKRLGTRPLNRSSRSLSLTEIGTPLPRAMQVRRARLRLGENRYHGVWNNCEHFCEFDKSAFHLRGILYETSLPSGAGDRRDPASSDSFAVHSIVRSGSVRR